MSNEERLASHTSTVKTNWLINAKGVGVDSLLHQGMHRIAWTTRKLLNGENASCRATYRDVVGGKEY